MLNLLEHDAKDAFGEPPRLAILLFALTELRLLAGLFGIESLIKKDPDIILTVTDAGRAQIGLSGAPGTLRVIDERTIYLRMPASFLEPETALMTLKNLMRKGYDREVSGSAATATAPAPAAAAAPAPASASAREPARGRAPAPAPAPALKPAPAPAAKPAPAPPQVKPAKPSKPAVSTELAKLVSLREQGILSEEEFQSARRRLVGTA